MDGREDPFRFVTPLPMGRLPDGPRSCCVRYGPQVYACKAIWPEQFAPLRLVRNLSQFSFSGTHLGTKYSLLGLG
ncbi:unnamed protein product [Penicillium camemberti]|mgnify:CR=1 FL=1|uniref:Str. FM013 n=1 Tax=Penicillium camemberti (strain FM 013) TaxID=1429867 RepID=A0A0G4PI85_PENC3|nr:unnamed protein product [Penicillium camemberti]